MTMSMDWYHHRIMQARVLVASIFLILFFQPITISNLITSLYPHSSLRLYLLGQVIIFS